MIESELRRLVQEDANILALFPYGSHVYGTNHEGSDLDMIMVVTDVNQPSMALQELKADITVYDKKQFQDLIAAHEISALECIFLSEEQIIKKQEDFPFPMDKGILRHAISSKSSNSWVKCKKKLTVEKDYNPYIGKKSAWHALRILDFGTQIAQTGRIQRYDSVNDLLAPIMNLSSWEEIDAAWRLKYNEMASIFKQVAPKVQATSSKPGMK